MATTFDIYHDLIIDASTQQVFNAISLPEHLNNWWTLQAKGIPKKEELYHLYFAPEYDWRAKVSHSTLHRSFHLKMITSSEDWQHTTFGFDLEKVSNGTRVKFSHKNWLNCNEEFRNSSYCWALLLFALKQYIENGTIVPFNNRA